MKLVHALAGAGLVAALSTSAAHADDWTAVQLRGQVQQFVRNQWQPLERGMVVSDSRLIRTLASAHVTLTRGRETLDLGPSTQVAIHDRGTSALPNTTVSQYFGSVSVEAQVENVQHFAVETSTLAAVVKGTRFTVSSTATAASVSVQRGHVAVSDKRNSSHVTLAVGQTASVDAASGAMSVANFGKLPGRGSSSATLPPESSGRTPFGGGDTMTTPNVFGGSSSGSGAGAGNSGVGNGNGGPNGSHPDHGKGNG